MLTFLAVSPSNQSYQCCVHVCMCAFCMQRNGKVMQEQRWRRQQTMDERRGDGGVQQKGIWAHPIRGLGLCMDRLRASRGCRLRAVRTEQVGGCQKSAAVPRNGVRPGRQVLRHGGSFGGCMGPGLMLECNFSPSCTLSQWYAWACGYGVIGQRVAQEASSIQALHI